MTGNKIFTASELRQAFKRGFEDDEEYRAAKEVSDAQAREFAEVAADGPFAWMVANLIAHETVSMAMASMFQLGLRVALEIMEAREVEELEALVDEGK